MGAFNIMGNFRNVDEQDLISNLIAEAIEQRGDDAHYILRDLINPDFLFGESPMSDFKEYYLIPVFVESIEHFNGNGDMFDSFGVNYIESSIYQVASEVFKKKVGEPANIPRPREGDLIYLPISDSLWEITKVKMDLKYYQVGRNHSYRLVCKLFTYSHEDIETDTDTNFNDNSEVLELLDDEGLKNVLGINPDRLLEDAEIIKDVAKNSEIYNSDNAFGF